MNVKTAMIKTATVNMVAPVLSILLEIISFQAWDPCALHFKYSARVAWC